ncbi:MAG: hypothetical protein QM652_13325, partial [Legionella sp.]
EHHHHHDDHAKEHHHHHDIQELLKERLDVHESHNHDNDIPTFILKQITIPLYALAASWDYLAGKFNKSDAPKGTPGILSWNEAWNKQRGNKIPQEVQLPAQENEHPSEEWRVEHTLSLLQKHEMKDLNKVIYDKDNVQKTKQSLKELQKTIRDTDAKELPTILAVNRHSFYARKDVATTTQEFLQELPSRVGVGVAA